MHIVSALSKAYAVVANNLAMRLVVLQKEAQTCLLHLKRYTIQIASFFKKSERDAIWINQLPMAIHRQNK